VVYEGANRVLLCIEDLTALLATTDVLPICMHCKKIRDSELWLQVEAYLDSHLDLKFSHGICPDCATKLYPGKTRGSEDPRYSCARGSKDPRYSCTGPPRDACAGPRRSAVGLSGSWTTIESSRAMAFIARRSSGATSVTAVPLRWARPVRPTRCT